MTQTRSSTSSPPTTARLGRDDYLSAARRALHTYPGPVGELVGREISAHMDALVRTGDPLVPGLVTQLLGPQTPGTGRDSPADSDRDKRWRTICNNAALQAEYLAGRRSR